MLTTRGTRLLPTLACALALAACDAGDGTGGRLTIQLTDAAGDLDSAWVEITEVYLQGEGGRVYLYEGSTGLINLLELSGGTTAEIVDEAVVPEGTYSQLRFRIGDAYIVDKEGNRFSTEDGTLHCPSCQSPSGLKVKLPGGGVTVGTDAVILVVDFDVSQSFGSERGASGRWVMHPVMQATNVEFSGSIEGTVTLANSLTIPQCGTQTLDLGDFVPTATAGTTVKTGTTDASTGSYRIAFVPPDTYTLGVDRVGFENGDTLSFTATATPASVEVLSGQASTANYQVTAAVCQTASSTSS